MKFYRSLKTFSAGLNLIHTVLLGTAILFAYTSFAQPNPNNLTAYTEKDGLPGTEVNKVLVDKFGYIWVGTINGLTRFDGYSFKRFYENPNDPGSIKGLIIWSIFEDSKGRIWIGAAPTKLNVYDPITQTFKAYPIDDLVEYDVNITKGIAKITEDKSGKIYFGLATQYGQTISNTLLYLDEKEDKIKRVETPTDFRIENIYSMISDRNGTIWISSYSGLLKVSPKGSLLKISPKNVSSYPDLKDEYITDIISTEGYLWMMTNFGRLFKLNPSTEEYHILAPAGILQDNFINNLALDKTGNLLLATNGGLFLFDPKRNSIIQLEERSDIISMDVDNFGCIWIGTQTFGLFKYEERTLFKSYTTQKNNPNSLISGWADNIVELPDGKLLVTTGGLNIVDLETNAITQIPYKNTIPGTGSIMSAWEISPGEYYLSSYVGVYQFSYPANVAKKVVLPGLENVNWISEFLTDSRGNQWAFSTQGVYGRKDNQVPFQKLELTTNAQDIVRLNSVMDAYESKKHGLWLLTNDMLFLYNYNTGQLERKGHDKTQGDVFGTQDINSFFEDSKGIAWVGNWQGGLNRYDVVNGKIKTYTINDGLPSMSIQSILADEKNENLWLSTFEGISRFHIPTEQFYNYSIEDGIQSSLYADGSFLKTSKGKFIFGGSNGITIFDPENVVNTSIPPNVFLTELKLFNEPVLPGENSILKTPVYEAQEIELDYDQNNITLEFIALHYSNPTKNKYSYKLENYDNDWRGSDNSRIAYYPNLPPGEYTFIVKAANNHGVWNETGARLRIVVNKPWWNTLFAYVVYGIVLVAGVFGADRYFRHRAIAMERERAQVRELAQAREIEKAYTELKATQSQLIQSEKMASLGELTAGIAHEIQNPLNFVNNFSEVSNELIDEMKSELATGNQEQATEIANDIKQNLEKINFHGKRADAIVKSMLQHSRTSSGKKEITDINALCDEYIRLAYHGLRAKDKSFNAKFETNLDPALPKVNVVAQDIGRVVLNLINNAFYAVNEKWKVDSGKSSGYEPTVSVSTKNQGDKIEIRVSDNGNGIPDSIKDKIFQPFFTTKPTGQGTGLGLSLSYDIITKGHGGEIRLMTGENAGTEFVILLPAV